MNSAPTEPTSIEQRVESVLETIRPAIRADGGDIELLSVDEAEGRVQVRMVGACYACPMSTLTLTAGLEQRLRMQVPEVRIVESV